MSCVNESLLLLLSWCLLPCLYLLWMFSCNFALHHWIWYFLVLFAVAKTRVGCRGLPLLLLQHPEMSPINLLLEFLFLKMLLTRFLNLGESSCGRHCSETLTSVREYNISWCLVFNIIRDSVQCTKFTSLFSYN